MFDKLVESNAAQAEIKNRSRFFLVSFLVVGTLFLSAVAFSLYAAEISIGEAGFDISRLVAPEIVEAPEPVKEVKRLATEQRSSDLPTRTDNVARVDEAEFVPDQISTTPSNVVARPDGQFRLDKYNRNGPNVIAGPVQEMGSNRDGGSSQGSTLGDGRIDSKPTTAPPPVKKVEPKKDVVITLGVVNSKAKSLPPPPYPKAAQALGIEGIVNVQITIDEQGNVISSRAVDGSIMLRRAAEQAAWKAKFTPTLLSNQPVKVSGLIAYNFKKR